MNIYANIFNQICNYEFEQNNMQEAKKNFEKAIEFNAKDLILNQSEIDDLLEKYQNKSISINKSLLAANSELLKDNTDSKAVMLFLTEKYFKLDGITELFFQSVKFDNR